MKKILFNKYLDENIKRNEALISYYSKEDLDKCSTCDMNCVINNGLSEASKEQLKHKTGEEIVDADIAQQMETK